MAAGRKKMWVDVYKKSDRLTQDTMLVRVFKDIKSDKYPCMTYGLMKGLILQGKESRKEIEDMVLKAMKNKPYVEREKE